MMKTIVLCALLVVAPALCPGAGDANQSPPAPPQAAPPQAGPSAPAGDKKPALEPSGPADPAKLADPKPALGVRPPAALPVDDKTYQIGAQDVLSVLVIGEKDYSGQYLVRPDGRISLPFIGEVVAAGRTPEELTKDVAERLTEWVKAPEVSVSLVAVKSKKYYINGEVLKPGEFDLIVPTTVMEGLVQAGGFKDFANQKDIRILRDGGKTVLHFNFKEMLKGQNLKQNVLLQNGDIIVVK
jgi:polysaccharide export outer membrane protein